MADHILIHDTAPRIRYVADGAQKMFVYPFPIFAAADLEVHLDADRQTSGFTVDGAGEDAGGNVVLDVAPAAGVAVTLTRRLAVARTSDFQDAGEFRAKVLNDELDRIVAMMQQLKADVGRAVRLAETAPDVADLSLPPAAAGRLLGWNAAGDGLENKQLAGLPGTAAYAEATPADVSLAAAATAGVAAEVARGDHAHAIPVADRADAEAGIADDRVMTPLATAQAIDQAIAALGPTVETGTWTPELTFATPGDLAVTYTFQLGSYIKIGTLVLARFNVQTASFAHSTAAGSLQITGLPFPTVSTPFISATGAGQYGGITKPNRPAITALISANDMKVLFNASGSGQTIANVKASDMPAGGVVVLNFTIAYEAAT